MHPAVVETTGIGHEIEKKKGKCGHDHNFRADLKTGRNIKFSQLIH